MLPRRDGRRRDGAVVERVGQASQVISSRFSVTGVCEAVPMSERQFDTEVPAPAATAAPDAAPADAAGVDGPGFEAAGFDAAGFCDWLRTLSLDALSRVADEHAAFVRAVQARQLLVLGVLAERSVHRVDGALDLAGWVAQRDAVRPGTARQVAAIAARLEQLPAIAGVAAAGALSIDQLAPLVRLADAETDAEWAERAPGWSLASLEQAARRRERLGSSVAEAAFQRRELRFWIERATGDGRMSGRMPADRMALVRSVVEQAAHDAGRTADQPKERWEARCADALADLVLAGGAVDDGRTVVAQVSAHIDVRALHPPPASGRRRGGARRAGNRGPGRSTRSGRLRAAADARGDIGEGEVGDLVAAGPIPFDRVMSGAPCCAAMVAPSGEPVVRGPSAVAAGGTIDASVHPEVDAGVDASRPLDADAAVSAERLGGGLPPSVPWAQLVDGTPISVETARRLSCDARIQAWLVDRFTPFAAGRSRRSPTAAQHAALRLRAGCCEWPGCRRRRGLSAHHLHWWSLRGPTDLDNLVLLCWAHHHLVHDGGFGLRGDPTRPDGLEVVRPDARPLAMEPSPLPSPVPAELAAWLDRPGPGP